MQQNIAKYLIIYLTWPLYVCAPGRPFMTLSYLEVEGFANILLETVWVKERPIFQYLV